MKSIQEYVRGLGAKVSQVATQLKVIEGQHDIIKQMIDRPPSVTDEIDRIPGRRIFYNLNGEQRFDISDNNRRGQPVNFLVSQDGPFIMTHYPLAVWRPSEPDTATNFGLWRPVSTSSLPDQATPASANFDLDEDIISISYELQDGGSQRNFQNLPTPPVLSLPGAMGLIPLPVPTLFTPNTTIQFLATYNSIRFSNGAVPPTAGILSVALPGYRIVNL